MRPLVAFAILVSCALHLHGQQTLIVPSQFPSIQSAISAANAGDTVIVDPGTYGEGIDFLGKAITVRSSGGAAVTTIDPAFQSRCAVFVNGEGPSSVLDGFRLIRGRAPDGAPVVGGGIGNDGAHGGGVLSLASPTIMNCIVRNCLAGNGSNGSIFEPAGNGGDGGGVYAGGSTVLINCLIIENQVGLGGTITFPGSNGVGAGLATIGNVLVLNCTIANNGLVAPPSGPITPGGVNHSTSQFVPVTLTIQNSVVWGNAGSEIGGATASISVSTSDVEGGFTGTGNIAADPLFANVGNGDFRLGPGSPCTGTGDNSLAGIPVTDLDGNPRVVYGVIDMGPFESLDVTASPAMAGNIGIGVGGPFEILRIDGSTGGPGRRVSVPLGAGFNVDVQHPPTTPLATDFVIFGQIGVPTFTAETALPIGTLVFTPCVLAPADPVHFMFADTLGLAGCAALVPATTTPWSTPIAGIPFPLTVTLQGVVLDTPTSLAVTNAVILDVQ